MLRGDPSRILASEVARGIANEWAVPATAFPARRAPSPRGDELIGAPRRSSHAAGCAAGARPFQLHRGRTEDCESVGRCQCLLPSDVAGWFAGTPVLYLHSPMRQRSSLIRAITLPPYSSPYHTGTGRCVWAVTGYQQNPLRCSVTGHGRVGPPSRRRGAP